MVAKTMLFRLFSLILFLPFISSAQSAPAPQQMRWNSPVVLDGGRDLILIGGSMHYFRVPAAEWEGTFRRMHADGFNVVDTVIPWAVHEPEEGKVDFSALQRFFDLAQKYSLYIVARPGPIYALSSTKVDIPAGFPAEASIFARIALPAGNGLNIGTTKSCHFWRRIKFPTAAP